MSLRTMTCSDQRPVKVTVASWARYWPGDVRVSVTGNGPRSRAGKYSAALTCAGRNGCPSARVKYTSTVFGPSRAGAANTCAVPAPPGPPVLNAWLALTAGA